MKKPLEKLTQQEQQALREFRRQVASSIGGHLVTMRLFGSKARGEDTPESDIDIFITVDKRSPELEDRIIDIAFDINLKYGVYISPRVISTAILRDPVWRLTPFLRNIAKEGVPI